jgi:uncharacterized NAD(P)/FAD-binding protein YdhS
MRTLAIAALVLSTSAFACPDISGKYAVCRSQTGNSAGSTDMVITQSVANKVTTYSVTSTDTETNERATETFKADGKTVSNTQTDPDSGMTLQLATTVSCVGTSAVKINMIVNFNGEQAANIVQTISKSGKTLTMKATGNNMGEEINETVICE